MLNITEILKLSPQLKLSGNPILVYGAAYLGEAAINVLRENLVEPIGVCDSNQAKIGTDFMGFTVQAFDTALSSCEHFDVLIASYTYYEEIKQHLLRFISEERIMDIDITKKLEQNSYRTMLSNCRNEEQIMQFYQVLADEGSKKVLENIIKGRLTGDEDYYREVVSPNQYFNELVGLGDEEYFADVGACAGGSLDRFAAFVNNKFKRVYCFEPFDEVHERLLADIRNHHNYDERITPYKIGLYNQTKQMGFNNLYPIGATKIDESFTGQCSIQAARLDDIVKEKVTFIKMDIEGGELAALEGARQTILKNKPKLAICVYHKHRDIIEIPQFLMSLNLHYKFYLRHHQGLSLWQETVLYAV